MVEQGFLRGDDVADRDVRKIGAIGLAGLGVDIAGIGRAEGRAEHVRGDDEQLVRIDRLARPDQAVPRARLVAVRRVAAGEMVAAGVAMRAQDGVAAAIWSIGRREPAIGLVGDRRLGHDRAVGERKIAQREKPILDGADIGGGAQRQVVHRFLRKDTGLHCAMTASAGHPSLECLQPALPRWPLTGTVFDRSARCAALRTSKRLAKKRENCATR